MANCNPGQVNLDLADCYSVGINQETTVKSLYSTPADLINLGVNTVFALSGLIILFLIVYSGYLYIQDTSKGKDAAREVLTTAAKGFILMFSAYWIVQLVIAVTQVESIL